YTLTHAGKVYADTLDGVLGEAGDILQPIDRGEYSRDRMTGELGQLINGVTPGRESDSEITLFKSVGSAVLDLVTAERIYAKARQLGIGLEVDM
ncbi:MAG: ornithine cyclodeaminase family protein, partial [Eubacteriales bacterium]|nr:ornithine cyclodeaminase family protein [Eubacteriales bacterium]